MSMNVQCPRCGSMQVQLSNVSRRHGCLWLLLFGWTYVAWVVVKWIIGLMILVCFDWWMAIVKKSMGKGYVWKCKRWFSGTRKYYFCHSCQHNFKG